jgi:CreA protein
MAIVEANRRRYVPQQFVLAVGSLLLFAFVSYTELNTTTSHQETTNYFVRSFTITSTNYCMTKKVKNLYHTKERRNYLNQIALASTPLRESSNRSSNNSKRSSDLVAKDHTKNVGDWRHVTDFCKKVVAVTTISLAAVFVPLVPIRPYVSLASANDESGGSRVVGQLKGSGFFFKDTLQIESFDDPKVRGVKLYISTFQIPITERFGKNMFSDPSYASVACARTGGRVAVASNINRDLGGEEVFTEKKSLLFKELRVYRVYDEAANTVVYVSFNTRLDKGDDSNKSRFKSSLCAVNLDDPPVIETVVNNAAVKVTPTPVTP